MIVLRDDWQDAVAWDHFVERHDEARFCHLFEYASVVRCYGYIPRNICFLKDGQIVGVLPAVQLRSLVLRGRIVSQPFSEYGGLLLDTGLSEVDSDEIFGTLAAYVVRHSDVSSVEMHGNHGVPESWRAKWTVHSIPHHVAVLSLDRSADELWRGVVRHSARKAVNQAQNHGIRVISQCDETIIRERFFPLYLSSMKRLGVPPHDINYYLGLFHSFRGRMTMLWAMKDLATLAGLVGFACGSRVSIVSTVSDPRKWHLRPNDLLHWEFIKWAAENGHSRFDFGSVRYQGQANFKKKWGCNFLVHKYHFIDGSERTRFRTLNSSSSKMRVMAALWSRYVPLGIGEALGPIIRKQLAR